MESSETRKTSLKLLIDTKNKKVIFAEAGKEFVDFLFYLLALPIGSVVRLLSEADMVGCLGNLYKSVKDLSESYLQENQDKDVVLNPKTPRLSSQLPLLMCDVEFSDPEIYMCRGYHLHASNNSRAICPACKKYISLELSYVAPNVGTNASSYGDTGGGFVKGLVTYMILDDLTVEPMSTISGITLLNKFNIKEVGSLEEKVVNMTVTEGLKLLRASLQSKTILSSVFLGK